MAASCSRARRPICEATPIFARSGWRCSDPFVADETPRRHDSFLESTDRSISSHLSPGGPRMSPTYELRGPVAVITLDNPPVNGLGYDTRKGITDGLDKALDDAKVEAIVITGAGKAFSGGADIREFGSPQALAQPNLPSGILAGESSTKPVVAAIHGVCMGGGLELTLGCHWRVVQSGTQVAL